MTTTTDHTMSAPVEKLAPLIHFLFRMLALALITALPLGSAFAHDHEEGEGAEVLGACAPGRACASGRTSAHDHEERKKAEDHGHEAGGHVEFDPASMRELGVSIRTAGAGELKLVLPLNGKLVPHEDRVAHIIPRYPGILREVRKRLGDPVAAGEVVAVVENNQSLQPYEVRSLLAGAVVRRHATIGEFAGDTTDIFEVADYSELFADFYLFPAEFEKVQVGQKVVVRFPGQDRAVEATISFLSPVTDSATQSRFARAVIANPGGVYQPGMFVTGEVVLEEVPVRVAVQATALRMSEGKTVVFVAAREHLEPRPVSVGRRDRETVEILRGLSAGERYAAGNTFILQAELEKGEAEHEH